MPVSSDPHSFSRPDQVAVRHLALDLTVDFAAKVLTGQATLELDNKAAADSVILDTRGLTIRSVTLDDGSPASYELGPEQGVMGQPLTIRIQPTTKSVRVDYTTSPEAAALQWLEPAQTAGGKQPFLFTQSQAILARTWIPLQDSPGVRFTYEATVHTPRELMAVMSAAGNPAEKTADGVYRFRMPQAIPSYLMALGVGDLAFRSMSARTGIYAEPAVVEKAAWEFDETEKMIVAAEALYGPYRWERYDLLVLPPSFPFGGMENPRLTFATPTVIAGDRSLVALVAHELAHSWSGNLVTNADWSDFWLNEGFTVYFERRILEALYGHDHAEMHAVLALRELRDHLAAVGETSPETHLHQNLKGKDPDDAVNAIAYEKGYFFLRTLETAVGRDRWDAFLRRYFDSHAFQSMTGEAFLAHLAEQLPEAAQKVDVHAWVDGPGLPAGFSNPTSRAFVGVEAELAKWKAGAPAATLATGDWNTQQRLHFLQNLPAPLTHAQLTDLDRTFGLTKSGNSEIQTQWYEIAVKNGYREAYPALENFLLEVGRRKFLRPLYAALAATPEGKDWARGVYSKARPGYHSVAVNTVDSILGWP